MTPAHSPDDSHPVDAAVRAHLDTQAAEVDPRQVLAGVKRKLAQAEPRPSSTRRWVRWATVAMTATAACLLVGLFLTGNTPTPPRVVSAAELLEEAKAVHETTVVDRCYQVDADWNLKPGPPRGLQDARSATLWTRGDQFVVLSAVDNGPPWAWGQEQSGSVWLVPNRRHAIVFDRDELNDPLAKFCELMSLRMVSTLGEVLEKYELFRKDTGQPGEPIRIVATLRPALFPGVRFRRVELELDPETKVVRSAVLHRFLNGMPEGTIRFTLIDTADQPDDFYTLTGHTDRGVVVLDGRRMPNPPPPPPPPGFRAKFREELLKRWQNRGR